MIFRVVQINLVSRAKAFKQNSGNKYNVALVNSRKLRLLVKIFNKVIRHF